MGTGPELRPENPKFTTPSEELVWERLRRSLPDEAVLMANLRITDERKDHEADLVALMPGVVAGADRIAAPPFNSLR